MVALAPAPVPREGRLLRHREGERPIPNYKLEAFLGAGGYGEVWRAVGPGGVPCALKFIRLDSNAGLKELKSIGLVKRLRHPNLVPLNAVWLRDADGNIMTEGDNGESISGFRVYGDKELVIAMGLGTGGSLADLLTGARAVKAADALPGGLSLRKLLDYMMDAAKGIDCLNDPAGHDNPGCQPIIHCDIKPGNLLLVGGGVQVCDYGVAKAIGQDIKKTMASGTAAYAAPELINNDPGVRTDQYSLAISFYELRTGQLPLDENRAMQAHILGQLDFSRVPADEREVLQKATALTTRDRFPSCVEFVDALWVATGRTISTGTGPHPFPSGRAAPPDTLGEFLLEPAPPAAPARPTADVLRPSGSPIPGFVLVDLLGQGGYGQVWKATDEDGVACALKILRDVQGKGRQEYETLVRLRKFKHPNLLPIEKLWVLDEFWAPIPAEQLGKPGGREARRLVIRSPLADRNLYQRLRECQRQGQPGIPPAELLAHLRQAADALDFLNIEQRTQHRDVKPENLLLTKAHVWVSDFGLAKLVPPGGTAAQSTGSGMTQEYASPEVLKDKMVTGQSDQYSLAVTYHVLRTGRKPFPDGLSMFDLINARASTSLDLSAVTEAERPVLRRALAANPADRFDTCRDLMRELGKAVGLTTGSVAPVVAPPAGGVPVAPGRGTLAFPDSDTVVRMVDDPDNTATRPPVFRGGSKPSAVGDRPSTFKVDEERRSGGKLPVVLGGLAVAALGLGAGAFVLLNKPGEVATAPTTPATPAAEPKTAPTAAPKSEPAKPLAGVWAAAEKGDWREARGQLAKVPTDLPAARAWADVLTALTADPPARPTLDDLKQVHERLRSPVADDPALTAARKVALTRVAERAVPQLDPASPADWEAVRAALADADGRNEVVAAGRAEAELELRRPAAYDKPGLSGYGDYLAAATTADPAAAADKFAALDWASAGWARPHRAARAADALATAVADSAARPEQTAAWVTAAAAAFDRAGPRADAPARERLEVRLVELAVTRPELKPLVAKAVGRLEESAHVGKLTPAERADLWANVAAVCGGDPVGLAAARKVVQAGPAAGPAFARVVGQAEALTADVGTQADKPVKAHAAELLAAAGRDLVRRRGELAASPPYQSEAAVVRQAVKLFDRAYRLGELDEYLIWQGVAQTTLTAPRAEPPAAALTAARRAANDINPPPAAALLVAWQSASRATGSRVAGGQRDALKQLDGLIKRCESAPDRFAAELGLAYLRAGESALRLANLTPPPQDQEALVRQALDWGRKLDKLDPTSPDGPTLAGCAAEDIGWLVRDPQVLRTRVAEFGPYYQAEGFLKEAERRGGGPRASLHRGRNLFKWAEDEAQLGQWWAPGGEFARPNENLLGRATAALAAAGKSAEAAYWLARVAFVRYQAEVLTNLAPAEMRRRYEAAAAAAAAARAAADPEWRALAARAAVDVHELEAQRQKDSPAAARAAVEAAVAALPDATLADPGREAKLYARLGLLYVDAASGPPAWVKARDALERAVELGGAAEDRWRWRFHLGQAEDELARQKGGAAVTHHALAANHAMEAWSLAYAQIGQSELTGSLQGVVRRASEALAADKPAGPIRSGNKAAIRLVQLAIAIDNRVDEFKAKGLPAATSLEIAALRATVEADRKAMDKRLLAAAEDCVNRVKLYNLPTAK